MLRIKLVKSPIGNKPGNRKTIAALGLRKMHQVVEHADTPTIRGMIHHAKHMLEVTEVEGEPTKKASAKKAAAAPAAPAKEKAPKAAKPKAEKASEESEPAAEAKPKRTTKKKTEEEK
ncbi:MAG: 50S ribosomal protein L30 [Armatimonadetes bacterium 55-13]|nr:50S ribosomal protein L30 [Armatimonadota bacterium]OJU64093.1 MAG: 50S ribosomal protein L30 [Armatimonadetes bacterium 55-13]